MLTYEFLGKKNNEYVYAYYPNGDKTSPGIVGITEDGEKRIIEESKEDFGKRYAYHALEGIDITKEAGTVAWY